MLPALHALSAIAHLLAPEVENAGLGSPRTGKITQGAAHAEMGLYVDDGVFSGTAIALKCKPMASEVDVTIVASSKFRRGLAWASLAVGVTLGLFATSGLDWEGPPKIAVGLLGGAVIALGLTVVFSRMFRPNKPSIEMTDRLEKHLRPILEEQTRQRVFVR